MIEYKHLPVLLNEAITGLNINPQGIYVDSTMGGAGHSFHILKQLKQNGHLYCFDQDHSVLIKARELLMMVGENFTIIPDNFVNIKNQLQVANIKKVDGILYDLGVSSFQFDDPKRGFSYHSPAHLDMRMNQNNDLTAYKIVNEYSYDELKSIFYKYGEEKFAPQIAKRIVIERKNNPIELTTTLSDIILKSVPSYVRRRDAHPAKKVFQALRIAVNNELTNLELSLKEALSLLNKGGRIVVISFHSLEDRIVKEVFRKYSEPALPPGLPVRDQDIVRDFCLVNRKVIVPSEQEIRENNRARSAKMRIIEKL